MESINVTGGAVEDMHEHRFGRLLCGTDRKSREKGLKRVKVFMQAKEAITVDDCVKLWKGLWYAMFLADKPLVQEELADNLAAMVHVLNDNVAIVYIQCFYVTLLREWGLIDHHRYVACPSRNAVEHPALQHAPARRAVSSTLARAPSA